MKTPRAGKAATDGPTELSTEQSTPVTADASAEASAEPADGLSIDTPATGGKSKGRRKSSVPEHQRKKLNKKPSKAKMNNIDAQPGDYFMIRLKGYPNWPAIVCDETMLPVSLLKNRPVTAARPDGTYRQDYEDGGPKVKDRTFPVMYLQTNELYVYSPTTSALLIVPQRLDPQQRPSAPQQGDYC